MSKQILFVCSRCSKTLVGSAVCIKCDNKEAENAKNFESMVEDIAKMIKASRASMAATVENSGFSVKDLLKAGLDPEAASFIKSTKRKKIKRKVRVRRKARKNNK